MCIRDRFLASGIGLAIYALLWLILPTPSRAEPVIRVMDESVGDPAQLKSRFSLSLIHI